MALKQQIQSDLVEAMKSKDEVKIRTLRMLKAAILKFEVEGERKEATDADIAQIIAKEAKQRRDSIDQYKEAARLELADAEEKEVEVLLSYMPPQMSEEEITKVVKETLEELGAKTKVDMGRVMAHLMPKVKGMADGAIVNKIVNELLSE